MYKNNAVLYLAIIFCYISCLSPSESKNNFNCKDNVDFNKEIESNYSNSLSKSMFIKLINSKERLYFDTLIYKNMKISYINAELGIYSSLNSISICLNDTSFFVIKNNPINDNRVRFQYNDNTGTLMTKDSSILIIDSSIFYENRVLNEILCTLDSNEISINEIINVIKIIKYNSIPHEDEVDKRFEPILVQHSNLLNFIIKKSFLENCQLATSDDIFITLLEYSNKFDNKNTIVFYNPSFKSFDIFYIYIKNKRYFVSKQYTILPPCLSKYSPL